MTPPQWLMLVGVLNGSVYLSISFWHLASSASMAAASCLSAYDTGKEGMQAVTNRRDRLKLTGVPSTINPRSMAKSR